MKISHVFKSFPQKAVLVDFSAEIEEGQVNTLLGASGSGKTTLMRILCGLETPDRGELEGFSGQTLSVVFQEDRLCENLSAITNVRFTTSASDQIISGAFSAVGLDGLEKQIVSTLSGGQKRRVAIIRAVLSNSQIVLMDEPFKGLDSQTKDTVIQWVKSNLNSRTLVLITHDEAESLSLGSQKTIRID